MKIINKENGQRIFRDTYYAKPPRTAVLATIKAVFICLMSASLCGIFVQLYSPQNTAVLPLCAGMAALCSAVVYLLASLLPPAAVYGSIGLTAAVLSLIFRKRLWQEATYFWDYMMLRLNSRLLQTDELIYNNRRRVMSGVLNASLDRAFLSAALVLGVILAVVFTAALRKKPKYMIPLITAILLCAPAVAAESAGFTPLFVVYIACAFGISAISSSYDLDDKIVYGGTVSAYNAIAGAEYSYRRRVSAVHFLRRFRSDVAHYQKYTSNAIACAITAAMVFTACGLYFPEGKGISYQDVFDAVTRTATTIVDAIGNLLGTSFGTANEKGYFSFSSYGDISGSISIEPPGEDDLPVIEVTLDRNDIPVYLRGDIGVEFTGSAWKSVSECYDRYAAQAELDKSYYPEENYFFFRQWLASAGYRPDDIIPLQTVSVRYLRNTRVVFQPAAPYDLNYKSSDYYEWYGDFILRARHGFIKTHESLALTPAITVPYFSADGSSAAEILEKVELMKMYSSYYGEESYKYQALADLAYGHNDDASENLIADFADDFMDYYGSRDTGYTTDMMFTPNLDFVQSLCLYFRDNFSYSVDLQVNGKPEDSLRSFLYETHEGHCSLFASAMTMTLRHMGIPARYITGYVTTGSGEFKNGKYVYTLTDRNLHAWTEVFFPALGIWLPFDPTAAVPGYYETVGMADYDPYENPEKAEITTTTAPVTTPSEETQPTSDTTAAPDDPEETEESEEDTTAVNPSGASDEEGVHSGGNNLFIMLLPFIAGAVLIAAVVIIVIMFVRSVERAEKKAVKSFKKLPPSDGVLKMYRLTLKMLAREGIVPDNERMHEFAHRADTFLTSKGVNLFMADIAGICEKAEFADPKLSPVSEDERYEVYVFVSAVYGALVMSRKPLKRFFIKISLFL